MTSVDIGLVVILIFFFFTIGYLIGFYAFMRSYEKWREQVDAEIKAIKHKQKSLKEEIDIKKKSSNELIE